MEKKEFKEGYICCICKKHCYGWGNKRQYGNNPRPVKEDGECCDDCNALKVIPARLERYAKPKG